MSAEDHHPDDIERVARTLCGDDDPHAVVTVEEKLGGGWIGQRWILHEQQAIAVLDELRARPAKGRPPIRRLRGWSVDSVVFPPGEPIVDEWMRRR